MALLVKLGIRLNMLCMIVVIISGIAVYGFDMGNWRFLNVPVHSILAFFTYAALIVCFLQNLAFKPLHFAQSAQLAKRSTELGVLEGEFNAEDAFYLVKVIDAKDKQNRIRYIGADVLGVVVFVALGVAYGSPVSEFAALAVLFLGPTLIGHAISNMAKDLREENPDLYAAGLNAYLNAHSFVFDHNFRA